MSPVNHQFPSTLIGKRERCFNPKWYEKYEWLEYSMSTDAVFCYWKHATGKGGALVKHDTSLNHQEAPTHLSLFLLCNYNSLIIVIITTKKKKEETYNRSSRMAEISKLSWGSIPPDPLRCLAHPIYIF